MKILNKMKEYAKNLKKEITAIYYAYQDHEIGLLPKIIIFLTIAYATSPIDLIPDFIPILGYLDDLIIVPALITLSIKLIPEKVMNRAKEKALKEPLTLKKNWFFAVLFILIWIILITFILLKLINIFKINS
ncbi:MAG: YkvA family protein [Brevinematales bacterium]